MSIAINTRRGATVRVSGGTRVIRFERAQPDVRAQMRDMRALVRHFVLAFAGAGAALYSALAAGLL